MVSGAGARKKGHDFERAVARLLQKIDPTARRNVEECQQASVDIKTVLPYGIQCKRLGRWTLSPNAVLKQAANGSDKTPVAIIQTNHNEPVVVMYLEDWFQLLLKIYPLSAELLQQDHCMTGHTELEHGNGSHNQLSATEQMKIDHGGER